MKIFCSYPYTGEDITLVTARMRRVVDVLLNNGAEVYCDRFDSALGRAQITNNIPIIFQKAFDELDSSNILVAILPSARRSVGQLMEIGVAYDRQIPVYLFEHESARGTTYLPMLARRTVTWKSEEDLEFLLASTDLTG